MKARQDRTKFEHDAAPPLTRSQARIGLAGTRMRTGKFGLNQKNRWLGDVSGRILKSSFCCPQPGETRARISGRRWSVIGCRRPPLRRSDAPNALQRRFEAATIHGPSVLATAKPRTKPLNRDVNQLRLADRPCRDPVTQEPPRTTWRLQSALIHAEPSSGAPL